MQQLIVFLLVGAAAVVGAEDADLAAENARLKKEIEKLQQGGCSCDQPFSFHGAAKRAAGLTATVTNHILGQTDLDDKLADHASKHFETAKTYASDGFKKVASVDYAGAVQDLTSHPLYVTHVAPHVEKISTAARPYVDQYVNPAMEKASVHLEPALKTAKETYSKAEKKIREDVMPEINRVGSKAFEHVSDTPAHLDKAQSALHTVVSPPYDFAHRIAPDHAKELPRHPVDRLLLIIVILFVLYHTAGYGIRILKFTITVTRILFKITWFLFSVIVLLPLKIAWRVFWFFAWLFTFFGCFGLCCRRKAPAESAKTNGKTEAAKTNGPAKDVTVEEIVDLLEKAKKENKLQALAKQLVEGAKNGKAMVGPPKMKGKKVPKEVVKKALSKYKELDLKKLGL